MTQEQINQIIRAQKSFFDGGNTLDIKTRKCYLIKLRETIKKYESEINSALKNDLGKSATESYMCEIGMTLSELTYQIKHIKKFARKKRVKTPMAQYIAKSYCLPSPYGVVLIMSPWNYPFMLSLEPLIEAISAGNTVVLKPSAYSKFTDEVLIKILGEVFPENYVSVITGGREENQALMSAKFDYVFFTGSKSVGKMVYESASKNLTPVTLELGGKSPCIVDESAKIGLTARRIVFGKFLNCGQTCVAPDYILCQKSVKDRLIGALKQEIIKQFGENALDNESYGKMISKKHYDRVKGLIVSEKVVFGGKFNDESLKISPTIMDGVTFDDAVMGEEIFGPLLPVLTFDDISEVIDIVNSHESPLALYIFSTDKKTIGKVLSRTSFGGGCVNDVIIHLATSNMPFGGVGQSGIGSYHGKTGFETFTHYKSIVDKKNIIDLPMRYQPYKKFYQKLIRLFLR